MRLTIFCVAAALIATLMSPANAQFRRPEDAIKYRQSAMSVTNNHMGRLFAMANARTPFDAKAAAESAEIMALLGPTTLIAFAPGTEGGKAKPELWKETAKFKELTDKSNADLVKLAAAAKTGNFETFKPAVAAAVDSCTACHELYRQR